MPVQIHTRHNIEPWQTKSGGVEDALSRVGDRFFHEISKLVDAKASSQ